MAGIQANVLAIPAPHPGGQDFTGLEPSTRGSRRQNRARQVLSPVVTAAAGTTTSLIFLFLYIVLEHSAKLKRRLNWDMYCTVQQEQLLQW